MNLIFEDLKSIFNESNLRQEEVDVDDVYKLLVLNLSNNDSDQPFTNGNGKHAEFALTQIFKSAKSEVNIFADSLHSPSGQRSSEYLRSIKHFLFENEASRLNIILEKDIEISESLNFIKALKRKLPKRVQISVLPKNYDNFSLTKDDQKFHFTIADGKMVRFEYDVTNRKASLNFNDPDFYNSLKESFDKYLSDSLPVNENYHNLVSDSINSLQREFSI